MNAEIIAVGSEMLTPGRVDTNSLWLTEQLNALGVEVAAKMIVGDDRDRLAGMIAAALERSEILILTGGLGPTEDDVTREAAALATGRQLVFRQDLFDAVAERFARMKRRMADNNKRQAFVVEGAEALPNPDGTAPGQWMSLERGRMVMMLPGPPREMRGVFTRQAEPRLRAALPKLEIATCWFRVAGMGESDLDSLIAPVYTQYSNPVTTILAKPGDVEIHLRARGDTAEGARALADDLGGKIAALLGDRIYSTDGATLEETVGRLLRARGETVAVAESCTGGLLGERITNPAGSSDYFVGGFVTYSTDLKCKLLGVPEDLIAQETAVSEPVAIAMAEGARNRTGATYALSTTGFAGPSGGTERDPAGTVYVGLASPGGSRVIRFAFAPDRARVRSLAATTALDLLRRVLLAR